MDNESLLIVNIGILAGLVLIGIFYTKKQGFGKFTTSLILLTSALFVAALLFASEKIESSTFVNILFAVIGFAGGLLTDKDRNSIDG